MSSKKKVIIILKNKKAYHDFNVLEEFTAGIILKGYEVKSVKNSQVNFKGSYVSIKGFKVFIEKMHIGKYQYASIVPNNPARPRELLLKKKEIEKLITKLNEKGATAVPLEIFTKGSFVKIKIGICKGKKLYDKRRILKEKAHEKEIQLEIKKRMRS